jgi:hypothetical protein
MIQSDAKINIDQQEDGTFVSIYPHLKSWQAIALRLWFVIWVMTGLLAFAGMLREANSDQLVYAAVFMLLWAYFLYYAGRSVFWYQYGKEFLRITSESLDYKRSWGSYGRAVSYDLSTIKDLGLVNLEGKVFAQTYQDAFWTVGSEKIGFEYLGRKIVLGLRLSDGEAKELVRIIASAQKKAEKS